MEKTKPYVFDTLTHFVTEDRADNSKPLGIEGYLSHANSWSNSNVRGINMFTGACPRYEKNGRIIMPSKWGVRNGRIEEFSYETVNGKTQELPAGENCYAEANDLLLDYLNSISAKHPELSLFQSPMIHPRRTSPAEIERLIEQGGERILGFKVHGIASASGPGDFNPELARAIAKSGRPLIIHTDFNSKYKNGQIVDSKDALAYLRGINNPGDWVKLCQHYGIKASLQHGARNDKEVYKIIKANPDQFTVGLGPLLNGRSSRMAEMTDDYVKAVFDNLGPGYVVFSSDYPFNENNEDLTEKVESLALSEDEQEKVFHGNAEKFFGVESSR